jgi:hypothetical protein
MARAIYHVTPAGDAWRVKRAGTRRATSIHHHKSDAGELHRPEAVEVFGRRGDGCARACRPRARGSPGLASCGRTTRLMKDSMLRAHERRVPALDRRHAVI